MSIWCQTCLRRCVMCLFLFCSMKASKCWYFSLMKPCCLFPRRWCSRCNKTSISESLHHPLRVVLGTRHTAAFFKVSLSSSTTCSENSFLFIWWNLVLTVSLCSRAEYQNDGAVNFLLCSFQHLSLFCSFYTDLTRREWRLTKPTTIITVQPLWNKWNNTFCREANTVTVLFFFSLVCFFQTL